MGLLDLNAFDQVVDHALTHQVTSVVLALQLDSMLSIRHLFGGYAADYLMESMCGALMQEFPQAQMTMLPGQELLMLWLPVDQDPAQHRYYGIQVKNVIQQQAVRYHYHPVYMMTAVGIVSLPITSHAGTESMAMDPAWVREQARMASRYAASYRYDHVARAEDMGHFLQQAKNRMLLAHYVYHALKAQRYRLAYQPIVNTKTGTTDYYECLLRFSSEDGHILSAGPFIAAAEEQGLIGAIDECVMDLVLTELETYPNLRLSFNISNITTESPTWIDAFRQRVNNGKLGPRVLLELTETGVLRDLKHMAQFVGSVSELGCQVAIDDFGSGYTSFRQMRALPVDIVKIDGIFIRDIVNNHDHQIFVRSLVQLIDGCGLKAVAEFVESGEIAKMLMDFGVPYLQGNYFSPAVLYRPWEQALLTPESSEADQQQES